MSDAFRNLSYLDPYLNGLVVRKIKLIAAQRGGSVSMTDLTDQEKIEILEEYALSLYKEYWTLQTMFLEGMHQSSRHETLRDRTN